MQELSRSAIVLWAAGLVLNVGLLTVLLWKRRMHAVPWFTLWIGWAVLSTAVLFLGHRYGSRLLYADLYWTAAFIELLIQLAVVAELAASVFRRRGSWIASSRVRLAVLAGGSAVLAALFAVLATPAAASQRDAVYSRISLFETVLFTGLFTGLITVSQQLGVTWRDLVLREGAGLLLLNLCSFATDTLHVYWRTAKVFGDLETVRMVVYLAVLTYWVVVFWLPERSSEPPGFAEQQRLAQLWAGQREDGPRGGGTAE